MDGRTIGTNCPLPGANGCVDRSILSAPRTTLSFSHFPIGHMTGFQSCVPLQVVCSKESRCFESARRTARPRPEEEVGATPGFERSQRVKNE